MSKPTVKKTGSKKAVQRDSGVASSSLHPQATASECDGGDRWIPGWESLATGGGDPDIPVLAHHIQIRKGAAFPALQRNPKLRTRNTKWYGWQRDLPDARDHLYSAPLAVSLPPKYDLRDQFKNQMPPIYNQRQLGSCSGNAIAGAIQFERIRQKLTAPARVPSRLFIYYNERVIEGTVDSDSGAQIRDGIKSVASQGDCFETGPSAWPYKIADFRKQPPPNCYKQALTDRVVSYSRLVQTLDQLKGCLASGYPFVFGFTVYESFESAAVAKSGVVPMPAAAEKPVGGHAVMAIGYDDPAQRFIVRNSWGKDWGQSGYFTIPYSYLTNSGLAGDFWTIRLISVSLKG